MSALKVAIAVPSGDLVHAEFAQALARLVGYTAVTQVAQDKLEMKLLYERSSVLVTSRQNLVHRAGAAGCSHILWLDSDMTFPADALVRLLNHNKPIVGANYPTRRMPIRPTALTSIDGPHQVTRCVTEEDSTGLEEVAAIGFGCVLTEVALFTTLEQPWFAMPYDTEWRGFVGEDVYFCGLAKAAGLPVYVDHDLSHEVTHIGVFPYRHEHALAIAESLAEPPKPRVIDPSAPPEVVPSRSSSLIVQG